MTPLDAVARLAVAAEVRTLLLFHQDPWRTDDAVKSMVSRCAEVLHEAKVPPMVESVVEGFTYSFENCSDTSAKGSGSGLVVVKRPETVIVEGNTVGRVEE